MTAPPADTISVAYDAYLTQIDHNLDTAAPSEELVTAVLAADVAAVLTAMRQMVTDAGGKAKLLWTGSPVGTILRNTVTGESAQRAINTAGIPLWNISDNAGNKWDSHEPVLTPEADWQCIYNPDTEAE